MKTIHSSKLIAALLLTAALFNFPSCKKETPIPDNKKPGPTGTQTDLPALTFAI